MAHIQVSEHVQLVVGTNKVIGVILRRDLIIMLGGAAVAWPLAVRAQEKERTYPIGVLSLPPRTAGQNAFYDALRRLGFVEGQKTCKLTRRVMDCNLGNWRNMRRNSSGPRSMSSSTTGRPHSRRPAGNENDPDPRPYRRYGRRGPRGFDGASRRQHDRGQHPVHPA